jgi:hypothetical protein
MQNLQFLDLLVVIVFFLIIFGIAAYYARRAGQNTGEFFLSGRNMPWYIAGTAMVATTFAADTPLAVTELVAKNGIAGNIGYDCTFDHLSDRTLWIWNAVSYYAVSDSRRYNHYMAGCDLSDQTGK